ncbi:hypothetical protein V5E97_06960 [Singulisphaera sp. Ch08]|uniref:Uncharacterized protein n=1 Tax=Singulisphaera sp. Ch08 TaxID=3120278 RepID=A0AAU7CKE5_9BACT
MSTAFRTGAVIVLAIGGLVGVGARDAQAQGVPYGPYSMTRSQFNQFAPVYYPRLNTNFGVGYYGLPRFYGGNRYRNYGFYRGGYGFNRGGYGFNRGFRRR